MTSGAAVKIDFGEFVADAEPRLRAALGAAFGFDVGEEATANMLAFACEHWDRVSATENPIGYLFAVARNQVLRSRQHRAPLLPAVDAVRLPWVEPDLPK